MADKTKPGEGSETTGNKKRAKEVVVEIICEGFLGTLLLKKGDRTSDPDYVALLDDDRELVRLVE